jgi:hypothetical protein
MTVSLNGGGQDMAKKKSINVTVLVDEAHKDNLKGVANELKDKGFVLKKSLGEIGVLTGSVPTTALAALSSVAGVSAVEEERTDYRTQQ